MVIEWFVIGFLIVVIIALLKNQQRVWKKLKETSFQKQSQSVKYGKMSEQFMPFLKDYPYDPQDFRFLGTPIDGVQFTGDKVIFMEFKASSGQLSEKQKRIKELVEKKKVEFEERRIA